MLKACHLFIIAIFLSCYAVSIFAVEMIDKPIITTIDLTPSPPSSKQVQINRPQAKPANKKVALMNIQLSPREKYLFFNMNAYSAPESSTPKSLPTQVNLGMHGVPVLNQGVHNSCVTFANTAAIDALLGKGDYISQLCHLNLGRYLKLKGYYPSGWDGSVGPVVLDQIFRFGIVNTTKQKQHSCGGVMEYPTNNLEGIGNPMTLEEFNALSENLATPEVIFTWQPIFSLADRLLENKSSASHGARLLLKIKKDLAANRKSISSMITFGVFLPYNNCSAGACADHHFKNDTWAITNSMRNNTIPLELGAHEMVVTAYDDYAVAVDREGTIHTGLLTLRNSWGNDVGDNGDYYMTYEFFITYAMEAQRIIMAKDYLNKAEQ
jgi:hypothetical protein